MTRLTRNYLIFCHIAVPFIFLGAARVVYLHPHFLHWEGVVLLAIAALPFLLPLLALYVKGVGKDGVIFNSVFEGKVTAPEPSASIAAEKSSPKPAMPNHGTLAEYSKSARKVLRTLWKFQRDQFKDNFGQRWAFGVHPVSMDYPQFQMGSSELLWDHLVASDARGMVFLTDLGVEFCRSNQAELANDGDIWDKFGPA